MIARFSPVVLALLLAACAAAMPGYSPGADTASKSPTNELGYIEGGKYVMSSTEKALECKQLTGSMLITIARLKDRAQSAKPSASATVMKNALSPILGGGQQDTDADETFLREKAKLEAYNRHLGEKGCKQLDIEAELARPSEGPKRY
jgi:hypothetical protein